MPLYTYSCDRCGRTKEHVVGCRDRDLAIPCECGGKQRRRGVEPFRIGASAYQMQAILSDGTRVPGHFGKDAKRRRKT